jgi:hypothetical protein
MTASGPGLLDLSTEIRFEILRHCLVVDRSIGFRNFVWLVHILAKIRSPLLVCKQLRTEGLAVFWGYNTILLNRFIGYDNYPQYSPNLGYPQFLLPRSRIRPQIFHLKLRYNLNFMHGTTADRMRKFRPQFFRDGITIYLSTNSTRMTLDI